MTESPVLSLCILTYNQPQAIEGFFLQNATQLNEQVEILIRDDSSNDLTKEIVEKYSQKLKTPVRYFKGEKSKHGGYDKALLFITAQAKGQFVWWFGDDLLAPNAVSRILSAISSHPEVSFYWLNARDIENPNDRGMDLGGDRLFQNVSEMFAVNVGLLGFPSATILKRTDAISGLKTAEKFIGTTLTGYYLVLHIATMTNAKSLYLQEPCLLSRSKPSGEARWYDSFQVHGINYGLIAQDFKERISRAAFRKGLADQFGRSWRAVLVERALGYQTGFASSHPKIQQMTKLYWSYPEYYLALPLMILPRIFLRGLYFTFQMIKRSRKQNSNLSASVD